MQLPALTPKSEEINPQNRPQESMLRDTHVVAVEDGEDGMLVAKCAELNVVTQGKDMCDVQHNAIEAVELMREELGKRKEFSIGVRKKS